MSKVDWGSLPVGADPKRDIPWGQDELGNTQYRMPNGRTYVLKAGAPRERKGAAGSRERLVDVLGNLVRGAAQGVGQAITSPGRALAGETMTNADMMATAGMVQLGGAAMPAPRGALRIFAGRNAKTADLSALDAAKRLAAEGVDRDQIWQQTGWGTGVDGRWRFEIDDSAAGLTDYAKGAIAGNVERSGLMPEIMTHPDLQAAYPSTIGEVTIDNRPGNRGGYYPDTGAIQAMGPEPKGVRQTLLHEAQHAIQGKEGFAQGTSPGAMFTAHSGIKQRVRDHIDAMGLLHDIEEGLSWNDALKAYADLDIPISDTAKQLAGEFGDRATAMEAVKRMQAAQERLEPLRRPGHWEDDAGFGPYVRTAGEVEARNVQARADMTPDQRRATPPWATQDTPDADQLLVYGDRLQLSARETPAQAIARMLNKKNRR